MKRVVLLDRDGTINEERDYLSDPAGLALLPRSGAGLRRMAALGFDLVVVTNQSGLARGYFDWQTLGAIHDRLRGRLAAEGVHLGGIYVCPHHPDDQCRCRKPRTGLVDRAARELGFDPAMGYVIGDNICDIELGIAVKARTILVRTGYGKELAVDIHRTADWVVDDLKGAAMVIEDLEKRDAEVGHGPN
ncbi:MAG: HAD family hydrolase [Myxococcota bacterium]|nr:HAD family hydrolase [Myxococcota bacterium]